MAKVFKALSTVTVGAGGQAAMEFTSIPATYTDLVIRLSARLTTSPESSPWSSVYVSLNGSSSNFTYRLLYGSGGAAASQSGTTQIVWVGSSDATASTFGNAEIYIPNYTGSNYKSISTDFVTENNSGSALMGLNATLWSNTAAITSFAIAPASGNFVQYSTATLYGISNA